jgi:hypothetical protein
VRLVTSVMAWGLPDPWGGPDYMFESHGSLALNRSWNGLRAPLVTVVLPSFVAACLLYWQDARRSG